MILNADNLGYTKDYRDSEMSKGRCMMYLPFYK